jgi:hypothetical protein
MGELTQGMLQEMLDRQVMLMELLFAALMAESSRQVRAAAWT